MTEPFKKICVRAYSKLFVMQKKCQFSVTIESDGHILQTLFHFFNVLLKATIV